MPYLGRGSDNGFSIRNRYIFTATANQQNFSGADANSNTLALEDGFLTDVFVNGIMLKPTTDYTLNNSTNTLSLVSAADANEEVTILVYQIFALSDAMPTSGGTFSGALTNNSTTTFNDDVTFTGANYNVVWDKSDNALEFADDAKLTFGDGADLTIRHDSSNNSTYIEESGTGHLIIKADDLFFQNAAGTQNMAFFQDGGVVQLRHNNQTKFQTSSTGATVTGTLTATTLAGTLSTAAQPNITSVGTLTSATVSGDLTVDTSTLKVDSSNNRVGIGTATPAFFTEISNSSTSTTLTGLTDAQLVLVNTGTATANQFTKIGFRFADGTYNGQAMIAGVRESATSRAVALALYSAPSADGDPDEVIRISSTGKVGIGTTNPQDPLHTYLASGQRVARFEANNSTSAHIAFKASNTSLMPTVGVKDESFYISTGDAVERINIDGNGRVAIIDSSNTVLKQNDASNLTVNCDNSGGLLINNIGQTNGEFSKLLFASHATNTAYPKQGIGVKRNGDFGVGDMVFAVDSNADANDVDFTADAKMTILQDGRIGIGDSGQTNVGMTFTKEVSGATLKITNATNDYGSNNIWSVLGNNTNDDGCNLYAGYSAGGHRFFVNGNGTVHNATGGYHQIASDERLKYDIKDANSQWDDIKQLKFRNFKKHDTDDLVLLGVIAQEAEKICPKLVMERNPLETEVAYNSEFGTLYTKDDAETQDVLFTKDDQDVKDGKAKVGDLKTEASKNIGDVKEVKSKVKVFKDSILFWKTAKALQEAIAKIETLEAKVKALEEA